MAKTLVKFSVLLVLLCSPVNATQVQNNPKGLQTESNIADVAEYVLIASLVLAILNRIDKK